MKFWRLLTKFSLLTLRKSHSYKLWFEAFFLTGVFFLCLWVITVLHFVHEIWNESSPWLKPSSKWFIFNNGCFLIKIKNKIKNINMKSDDSAWLGFCSVWVALWHQVIKPEHRKGRESDLAGSILTGLEWNGKAFLLSDAGLASFFAGAFLRSHCHTLQGAQGSRAHPSCWMLSHLCWQLELSATFCAAKSIYSPSHLYIHSLVIITLVKPSSVGPKKKKKKCLKKKKKNLCSSAEHKRLRLFWLLWLRNILLVLLLKAQGEIPHAQSHLQNSNVWKISSSSFISYFISLLHYPSPYPPLIFLYYFSGMVQSWYLRLRQWRGTFSATYSQQPRIVVSGDWLLGKAQLLDGKLINYYSFKSLRERESHLKSDLFFFFLPWCFIIKRYKVSTTLKDVLHLGECPLLTASWHLAWFLINCFIAKWSPLSRQE